MSYYTTITVEYPDYTGDKAALFERASASAVSLIAANEEGWADDAGWAVNNVWVDEEAEELQQALRGEPTEIHGDWTKVDELFERLSRDFKVVTFLVHGVGVGEDEEDVWHYSYKNGVSSGYFE